MLRNQNLPALTGRSLMMIVALITIGLTAQIVSFIATTDPVQEQVVFKYNDQERNTDYWLRAGNEAIRRATQNRINTKRAKNGILFIGDGMSLTTITAARILYGQLVNQSGEENSLSFEKLNNVALIKTYNIDQQIPDSAATATAILCGVKTNFYTLGVNANVRLNDTNCGTIQQNKVKSILMQAIEAGKSTGIITNTRITHATPAAAYAHVSNRLWECDVNVPKNLGAPCKDIARQLIEDEPGNKINVIMGGGRRCFFGPDFKDSGPTGESGKRQDGLNLIESWLAQKKSVNLRNFAFVNSTKDLRRVDLNKTDYLLGLFSYGHMNYEEMRDVEEDGEPSLSEMTETAIRILSKNPKGYLLVVEGGRIDHAHHKNVAGVALRETIALSWAVQKAIDMVNLGDTILAVTADHAQGNPILGLSRFKEESSQIPYTTLIYGNGPGNIKPRTNPSVGLNSTASAYHVQYAAIHHEEAFHDGSDVGIFASGPYSHLFQGVQEQNYIAHVYSYALCMGGYSNGPHCREDGINLEELVWPGASGRLGAANDQSLDRIGEATRRSNGNTNTNTNTNNASSNNPAFSTLSFGALAILTIAFLIIRIDADDAFDERRYRRHLARSTILSHQSAN